MSVYYTQAKAVTGLSANDNSQAGEDRYPPTLRVLQLPR
jgi:hypothetical protein